MKFLSKIKWYFYRWQIMLHPWEELYRIKQQYQYRISDLFYSKHPPINRSIYYINPGIEYCKDSLSTFVSEENYETSYFEKKIDIKEITNWRRDFKNNIDSKVKLFSKINKNDFESVGELKYAFEPSRMQHLPQLAAKVISYNDFSLLYLIEKQLIDWTNQNPYLRSFNWKDGIEAGIRVTNLIYCRNILFINKELSDNNVSKLIDRLVVLHYHYLINHLSRYSSANNHLLAELMGILVICINYDFVNKERQLNRFLKLFFIECDKQIYSDGFCKEQSICYHVDDINMFLLVISLLISKNYKVPNRILDKVQKMIEFLIEIRIKEKSFPDIGDNDDSDIIYPFSSENYNKYESVIIDGSILFNLPKMNNYTFDFKNYLLWGEKGYKKIQDYQISENIHIKEDCKYFENSGYFIFKTNKTKLLFDVGSLGLEPIAAHGHSDLLHFIFYYNNLPIIVDTGTYQYHNRYKKWRDYFRGISAHNTISIDNLNHAEIQGNMLWSKLPNTIVHGYNISMDAPYCEASHNGFILQGSNIRHCRNIKYQNYEYTIIDTLTGGGVHKIKYYLHFSPELKKMELDNNMVILSTKNGDVIILENSLFINAQLFRGNELLPLGWYAKRYDYKEPCYSLLLKMSYPEITEIKTKILLNRGN